MERQHTTGMEDRPGGMLAYTSVSTGVKQLNAGIPEHPPSARSCVMHRRPVGSNCMKLLKLLPASIPEQWSEGFTQHIAKRSLPDPGIAAETTMLVTRKLKAHATLEQLLDLI